MSRNSIWTFDDLAGLFDFRLPPDRTGSSLAGVSGISIDTRSLVQGDLFIAIDNATEGGRDGHLFVREAIDRGAGALMVSREVTATVPTLHVADTRAGLWRLGEASRRRYRGKLVGITGSSGKTTLRAWLEKLLAPFGRIHASTGSYNNSLGVPLSLAKMPADGDMGVFEIGTNHPGEIAPLAKLLAPDVAVLLNVLPAHIGNFTDMGALLAEKLSISEGLTTAGVMVLPTSLADSLPGDIKRMTFGVGGDVDGKMKPNSAGATLSISMGDVRFGLDIPFGGQHRLVSALACVAVLRCLALDPRLVKDVFSKLPLPDGRGRIERVGGITVIDDSYNANPVSMALAIESLKASEEGGRKIALLGEMLELGHAGPAAHLEVASACSDLDRVYSFGEGFAGVDFGPGHKAHVASADRFDTGAFSRSLEPGDTVLVKGSNRVFWRSRFVQKLLDQLEKR